MKAFYEKYSPTILAFVKAFLLAFALSTVFHAPLLPEAYETQIDYIIANIYELLGSYHFKFLLLLAAGFAFFTATASKVKKQKRSYLLLAFFFGTCLLLGNSYHEVGNWSYCFGSVVNFIKSILSLLGYAAFFQSAMCLLADWLQGRSFTASEAHFFSRRPFLKAFLILAGCYSIFVIISYPGNLCWDVIGQIEQVITDGGYSTHHPLAHTLIVGGLVQMGKVLFGSYEIGLFIYTWLQMLMFAAAFAATITVLVKRNAKKGLVMTLLFLYLATPIYTNLVSTAVKDIPFCAFVIGYVLCFALLVETPTLYRNTKFAVIFILLQIGVILFRNNGLPMVVISGVCGFLLSTKGASVKAKIKSLLVFFGVGVLIGTLLLNILAGICNASSGSKGEILSIPFQQTARYLQLYQNELTEEEQTAIETILGDVDTIAAQYDPDISDPVKALFHKDASLSDIFNYFGAWLQGLFKHPAVYAEAFLAHVHGWFTPSLGNSIRYETSYDVIDQGGLFPNADKIMIFFYRFANRFPLLGILENIGMAVWVLFFLTAYQRKKGQKNLAVWTVPLWVSLLICMASPCFWNHPRYALPILATLPLLYGLMLTKKKEDESNA
ncbi:MAG: hypothetical protein E7291_04660 [Lachnospiraceae bacterium]|nr:hypothetical protein [Lachnospiraceae bacterium]